MNSIITSSKRQNVASNEPPVTQYAYVGGSKPAKRPRAILVNLLLPRVKATPINDHNKTFTTKIRIPISAEPSLPSANSHAGQITAIIIYSGRYSDDSNPTNSRMRVRTRSGPTTPMRAKYRTTRYLDFVSISLPPNEAVEKPQKSVFFQNFAETSFSLWHI